MRPELSPELIDRLYRAAWAMCGSPHDAEDLVQETLARVLTRPLALRRDDPAPALMRTLRNTYLTSLCTVSRRPRTTQLPPDESAAMQSSLARSDLAVEQRETFAAIAALPEDFRAALVAVDVVGLSHRDAGLALRTREATVATRLFRARRRVSLALGGSTTEPDGDAEASPQIASAKRPAARSGAWSA
ncbi:MAG: RNA polymerase sigma factor [Solirubrobacterales bacterium]